MGLDIQSGKDKDDHSPTEKAGMWTLTGNSCVQQGESDEKFWILEHDTWLIEERYEAFKILAEYAEGTLYANIGLFMGMYCMDQRFAHWVPPYVSQQRLPNQLWSLLRTTTSFQNIYHTSPRVSEIDHYGIRNTALHPWNNCDTIGVGREIGKYFNMRDRKMTGIPTPTTQVISKKLCVTQDHHGYKDEHIERIMDTFINFSTSSIDKHRLNTL